MHWLFLPKIKDQSFPFRIGCFATNVEGDFIMEQNLIMCRSLTYAQRAMKTLERGGVTVALLKVPQSVSQTGCSYGLRVPSRYLEYCIRLLREKEQPFGKVFRYPIDGTPVEVQV